MSTIEPKVDIMKSVSKLTMVNSNTTLHWGQKYEPLSVIIYEHYI